MDSIIHDRGRGPEIRGTRITVYDVMDYTRMGWQSASIAAWLRLSSVQVDAAIAYIAAHREEVEREYEAILERNLRARNPPHVEALLARAHARLAELKRQQHLSVAK